MMEIALSLFSLPTPCSGLGYVWRESPQRGDAVLQVVVADAALVVGDLALDLNRDNRR